MVEETGSSVEVLRLAARAASEANSALVAAVRRADAAGIPRAAIGRAIGRNRATVSRWCDEP